MKFRFEKKLYVECSKINCSILIVFENQGKLDTKKKCYKEKLKTNQFMKANFNNSNYNN